MYISSSTLYLSASKYFLDLPNKSIPHSTISMALVIKFYIKMGFSSRTCLYRIVLVEKAKNYAFLRLKFVPNLYNNALRM